MGTFTNNENGIVQSHNKMFIVFGKAKFEGLRLKNDSGIDNANKPPQILSILRPDDLEDEGQGHSQSIGVEN